MNKKKKIALFTSTRAEYGSLNFLLKELYKDNTFDTELLVGGAHLLNEYGNTLVEIEDDGHRIFMKFPFLFTDSEKDSFSRSMGMLTYQIGQYYLQSIPDFIVLLGDRFELLPVASVALVMRIPVVHISGGEITEGAIDNQIRNAVSQIANLHLVATDDSKNNLIGMGVSPEQICVSGELGLDEIMEMELVSMNDIFNDLGLGTDKKVILSTFHPETISGGITPEFLRELYINILERFPDIQLLCTASNFDDGGRSINVLQKELNETFDRFFYVESLGKKRYYSILKNSLLVLGNSSSGIYEVQSFNIPTINIGDRQKGRLSNPNVINVGIDIDGIIDAIKYAQTKEFISSFWDKPNVYGSGNSAKKIVSFLKNNVDK